MNNQIESLQRTLERSQQVLQIIEEQIASYGIRIPPDLQIERNEKKKEIEAIKLRIAALEKIEVRKDLSREGHKKSIIPTKEKPEITIVRTLSDLFELTAQFIFGNKKTTFCFLLAFCIMILANPYSGLIVGFLGWDSSNLPSLYIVIFWLSEAVLLLTAIFLASNTMSKRKSLRFQDISEPKVIKGLRPFDFQDAEVFLKLQRQRSLQECFDSITSSDFRFGILYGESGCGKTSFLQAGLHPKLTNKDVSHRSVYVRFSDQEPIYTIAKAIAEQIEIPLDWLTTEQCGESDTKDLSQEERFITILRNAQSAINKPLVLLFDQFEQFFVHYKREEDQVPFVEALNAWYRDQNDLVVKILVSIRSDLMFQLGILHKRLEYALGAQEVFALKKFTPREASNILGVIADVEGFDFNRQFIEELAEEELASREDGLISPVDLQVLAWMLKMQDAVELRAFNRSAFEKFGGVEGLLQRFLERTLEARRISSQRQSAVKVLLALTDSEQQVRAGALTQANLEEKLKGTVSRQEIKDSIYWLAQGNVRLITPQEVNGDIGYELAHERLIPALMRQAGEELSAADKANQLLARRVNEWLGNQKQKRYLLGVRELLLVERQHPYIVWGSKREQKERLIKLSWKKLRRLLLSIFLGIAMIIAFFCWLWFSPTGQLQRIKVMILFQLNVYGSSYEVARSAGVFATNDDWWMSFYILNKYKTDRSTAIFIDDNLGWWNLPESQKDALLKLDTIKNLAESITDDALRAASFSNLAKKYIEIGSSSNSISLFRQSLDILDSTKYRESYFFILRDIIQSYEEINDFNGKLDLLNDIQVIANSIEDAHEKSQILQSTAKIYIQLEQIDKASLILKDIQIAANSIQDSSQKLLILKNLAELYIQLEKNNELSFILRDIEDIEDSIQNAPQKSKALQIIADIYIQLGRLNEASLVLNDVWTADNTIQEYEYQSDRYSALQKYVRINESKITHNDMLTLLEKISDFLDIDISLIMSIFSYQAANDIPQTNEVLKRVFNSSYFDFNSNFLQSTSRAYSELGELEKSIEVLDYALTIVESMDSQSEKIGFLQSTSRAYSELGELEKSIEVLDYALTIVESMDSQSEKIVFLQSTSRAYSELGELEKSIEVLDYALTIMDSTTQNYLNQYQKPEVLKAKAKLYIEIGEDELAYRLISELIKSIRLESSTIIDKDAEKAKYNLILGIILEFNDSNRKKNLLSSLLDTIQLIDDEEIKGQLIASLIYAVSLDTSKDEHNSLYRNITNIIENEKVIPATPSLFYIYAYRHKWEEALNILPVSYTGLSSLEKIIILEAERKDPTLIPGSVVLGLESQKTDQGYELRILIKSNDIDCENRTDWIEVITKEGKIIKRKFIDKVFQENDFSTQVIDELDIAPDQEIIIRTHYSGDYSHLQDYEINIPDSRLNIYDKMYGYNNQALQGSINEGFEMVRLSGYFANWLSKTPPLPNPKLCKEIEEKTSLEHEEDVL